MVKGNWERRVELAAQRRLAAKDRKASGTTSSSSSGSGSGGERVQSGESVCTKLAQYDDLAASQIEVWLPDPGGRMVCSNMLRVGDCTTKKCRLSHDDGGAGIMMLRNISIPEGHGEEPVCFPVPLQHLQPRDRSSVLFVSVDGSCVYDRTQPSTWLRWLESRAVLSVGALAVTLPLETLEDESDDGSEDVDSDEDVRTSSSAGECLLLQLNKILLGEVLSYCRTVDFAGLLAASRIAREHILRHPSVRLLRREAMKGLAAEQRRKLDEDRRRRAKQAHCKKSTKKDGFARGGPGGQR